MNIPTLRIARVYRALMRSTIATTTIALAASAAACRPAPAVTPTAVPTPTVSPSTTPTLQPARTSSDTATARATIRPTRTVTPTATPTPVPRIVDASLPILGRIGGGRQPGGRPLIALDGGNAYVVDGRLLTAYAVDEPARMRALGELLLPQPTTTDPRREPEWAALVVRSGRALLVGHDGTEQWLEVRAPERMALSEPVDSPRGRTLRDWAHRWRDGAVAVDGRLVFATSAADGATLYVATTGIDGSLQIERTIPLPGLRNVMLAADRDRVVVLASEDPPHKIDQLIDVPLDPPAWPPRRLVRRPIRFDDHVVAPVTDCEEAVAYNRALRFGTPGPYRPCLESNQALPLRAAVIGGQLVVAERIDATSWAMAAYRGVLGFETFALSDDGPPVSLGRTVTNLDEPFYIAAAGSMLFAPLSGGRLAAFTVGADGSVAQVGAVEGVGPVTSVAPLAGRPGWVVTSGAIVDARDPAHLRQASVVDGGESAGRVVLSAADDSFMRITGLVVTDASNPAAPRPVATVKVPDDAMAVMAAAHNQTALVGFSEYGWRGLPQTDVLATLDLSDPSAPRVLATISTEELLATAVPIATHEAEDRARAAATPSAFHRPRHVAGAHLGAGSAVVAMGGAVWTFDVSDPARPRHVGRLWLGTSISAFVPLDDRRFLVQLGIDDNYMEQHFASDLVLVTLDADRQPREAGRWSLPDARPGALAATGSTVLAVTRGLDDGGPVALSLAVIDAGDWRQPVITHRWPLPFDVRAVAVDATADRVYLAAGGEGLVVARLAVLLH